MVQIYLAGKKPGRKMRKSFTLAELSIVIVVIGILAIIAIPQFSKLLEKSKAKEAFTNLTAIYTAERLYHIDTGFYTTDINDLDCFLRWQDWKLEEITCSDCATDFKARAERKSGRYVGYHLYIDQTGTIASNDGYPYTPE